MNVNIIHNPNGNDAYIRLPKINKELNRQGFGCDIWDCVEDRHSVVRSINLSHKKIVQWAKSADKDWVCIGEDDCEFPAKDGLAKWAVGIDALDGDADIYLAGNYALSPADIAQRGLVKTDQITGLHCYCIYKRFYDTFLSMPEDEHIDTVLGGKGEFYTIYPIVAIQGKGWSSNQGMEVDYNTLLKGWGSIYGM